MPTNLLVGWLVAWLTTLQQARLCLSSFLFVVVALKHSIAFEKKHCFLSPKKALKKVILFFAKKTTAFFKKNSAGLKHLF